MSFWGLQLSKGLSYSKVITENFRISGASLDPTSCDEDDIISVIFENDDTDYILCNLSVKHCCLQVPLDLQFSAGDSITFSLRGAGTVFLTGYNLIDYDEDYEIDSEDECEVDSEEESNLNKRNDSFTSKPIKKRKRESSNEIKIQTTENNPKKSKVESSPAKNEKDVEKKLSKKEKKKLKKEQRRLNSSSTSSNTSSDKKLNVEGNTNNKKLDLADLMNGLHDMNSEDDDDDDYVMEEGENEEESDDEEILNDDEEEEADEEEEEESDVEKGLTSPAKSESSCSSPSSIGRTPMVKNMTKVTKIHGKRLKVNADNSLVESSKSKKKKNEKSEVQTESSKKESTAGLTTKMVKAGGVVVEVIKQGTGPEVKNGKTACVYYEGRLKNGKMFDKKLSGTPFSFRLGANEVIKAWDIGLQGMKVGGKIRITAPPHTAYGKRGAPPDIPPSSTLTFEVELKSVK